MNSGKSGLLLSAMVCALIFTGCEKGDDRLADKARIEGQAAAEADMATQIANIQKRVEIARQEGRAQAEAELLTQNGNLESKSREMETDLTIRQRFYQAVRGIYEGELKTDQSTFKVRVTLVPSLPPYTVSRTRQLEEVASDLNNLYFNAQIVQWNPADPRSAVGCRVQGVRPDLEAGEIYIASESCANLYVLRIAEPTSNARDLAAQVLGGKLGSINELQGEVQPTTVALVYQLSAKKRVQQ